MLHSDEWAVWQTSHWIGLEVDRIVPPYTDQMAFDEPDFEIGHDEKRKADLFEVEADRIVRPKTDRQVETVADHTD